MRKLRKRIFEIIEIAPKGDLLSSMYDWFMMVIIISSLIPLVFKEDYPVLQILDKVTVIIFIIDYLLRWITADYKQRRGALSFVKYPFTFMAIIDLVSILPSVTMINNAFKVLKMFRLFRTFRAIKVLRVFKAFRYSKNVDIIMAVFRKQKDSLYIVCVLAVGYILVSALIVFNVEPETFSSFFQAIYWATVSLTTVGYGDIYPVSTAGQVITMMSALMGIAIVALPAGIITAGYMDEIQNMKEKKMDSDN